jgi:hypothetical protein
MGAREGQAEAHESATGSKKADEESGEPHLWAELMVDQALKEPNMKPKANPGGEGDVACQSRW